MDLSTSSSTLNVYNLAVISAILFILPTVKGLEEGEICYIKTQTRQGTCRNINNCPEAQKQVQQGNYPITCGFSGRTPIVCCENKQPVTVNKRPYDPSLRISERKCLDYADLVNELVSFQVPGQALQLKSKCGWEQRPLIVGGTKAEGKEFPHMAAVGYGTDPNNIAWNCGGTLISERFVLTAAHCMDTDSGPATYVRVGDLNLKRNDDLAQPQQIRVAEEIPHERYAYPSTYDDIGLLRLERDVTFNEFVRPACLFPRKQIDDNKKAITTGWGQVGFAEEQSPDLLKVTLDLATFDKCSSRYKTTSKRQLPNGIDDNRQICAGGSTELKDSCLGDSGGPLVVFTPKEKIYCMYYVIGVTSFGKTCAVKNTPGVYSRVSNYLDWIEQKVWK